MESYFPALNLKAKLIVLMVGLLGLTLGTEVWVSLGTQAAIVATTQERVKDLARVIQISVQELTAVGGTDRDLLHTLRWRPAHQGTRSFDRVERKSDPQQLQSASDRRCAAAQAGRMAYARATQASR